MTRRGLDWEIHIDETSRDLWLIQGYVPPLPGDPLELLWAQSDEPVRPAPVVDHDGVDP